MDSRPNDETLLLEVAERDLGAFHARRGNCRALLAVLCQPSTQVPALRQVI